MRGRPHEIDPRDLAALASGDGEAFARVYEAKFPSTLAVARAATRLDEPTCLDIVQDAWTRFVRSPPRCPDERRLDAWLRVAVLSAARDSVRRAKRRAAREHATANGALRDDPPPDADERLAWIERELAALDPDTAAMLGLRFRTSMTLAALGSVFGAQPGAAHGRIARAVTQLRARAQEAFRD